MDGEAAGAGHPRWAGLIAFFIAALLSAVGVWQAEQYARQQERINLSRLLDDRGHAIEHNLERALGAGHVLAALVRRGHGRVSDFNSVAADLLALHPGASSLALAPGGVIREIAPLAANARAVGLDVLRAPLYRGESQAARNSGKLTLAGPVNLVQGGTGVVGRLPVFLKNDRAQPEFWGFVHVVLRMPDALDIAHLAQLTDQGVAYELWRTHPDTRKRQTIARSDAPVTAHPAQRVINVPNGEWVLTAAPIAGWGHPAGLPLKIALALLFSLMLGYLVNLVAQLHASKQQLEARVARRTADILVAQHKLRAALDAIPDLVWLKDLNGVYVGCNPQFERLFGASESEIAGKTDYDFIDATQADCFREHDRLAMVAGKPSVNEEWLTFARDGTHGLFETIKTPIFDADDRLMGILGIARDITARAKAEQALRESQQRARQYLNIVGVMLIALDTEGRVQLVNARGCELLGLREKEILGRHWFESFLPPRTRNEVRDIFDRLLQGETGAVEYTENLLVTHSGEERVIAWHNAALHDDAGRVTGVLASGEDITERKRAERTLRESRENLRLLLDSMAEGAYGIDFEGNCTFVNRAFLKILGYEDEREVLDKRIHALIHYAHPDGSPYAESECSIHRAYLANQSYNGRDEVFWRRDGQPVAVECWSNPILRDGVVVGAISTFVDISARLRVQAELALAAQVFEQSGEGILITDARRDIIMINRAFTAITGYSKAEVLGQNPRLLSSGRHDAAFYSAMWETVLSEGRWQGEVWNRRKDGTLYPELLSIIRVLDASGEVSHYIGISSDITQHKDAQAHIQRLAHFDPLTGLPNRILLGERISHELVTAQRNQTPLAVMFVDLDHFKNVNDTLGHRAGDELLVAVAGRLRAAVREVDTVSRQGGDEFILILPDTGADGAAHVAEKLLVAVAQPCQIENLELTMTLSIGIALYPNDGEDFETLSKSADTAMYRAKQDGRNTYRFFTVEMQTRSAHNLKMENALRRALERNQFELHYQPQVSLKDGRLTGIEALLRWEHPELGRVPPADFIPIAEESGQILQIGEWALRQAARQMKAWVAHGLAPLAMAVNLSAVQFRSPHLLELVVRVLEEAQLPPACLELELTESLAMDDAPAAIAVMDRLHAHGIRMSIDDFGTGYSSLSYLKRFKVHRLKIDQGFVRDIGEDPDDRAIVSGIINLAAGLGLLTIAEGVETEEQLTFLRDQGCNEGQGYYFSKPLPASQFEAFVRARYPADWSATGWADGPEEDVDGEGPR